MHGRSVSLASTHLAVDFDRSAPAAARGAADGLGLLLAHCDLELHRELAPRAALERLVFDIAEQIRCESLASPTLHGVPANLAASFGSWSQAMQAERAVESGVGLALFCVAHMIRSRLVAPHNDPAVDTLIENTRAELLPLIGAALAALPEAASDQRAYALHAREIAEATALLVGDAAERPASQAALQRARLVIAGLGFDDLDDAAAPAPAEASGTAPLGAPADAGSGRAVEPLESLGGYRVFTREYDQVVRAEGLVPEFRLKKLRAQLDEQRRRAGVNPPGLARKLRAVLSRPVIDGWEYAATDGRLDNARLARLAVDPAERRVFRGDRSMPGADACVSLLVDCSGSMKHSASAGLAALVDTAAQATELAGASCEVLGFTTASWAGGQARTRWQADGEPHAPGRLAELLHIVCKDARAPWRRARHSLAAMLSPDHSRESVYGEALIWAAGRLAQRHESRRILVLVSDAAPAESASAAANGEALLVEHFTAVAAALQRRRGIELAALTVDGGDLSGVIANSIAIDGDDPLAAGCDALVALLDPTHRRSHRGYSAQGDA